MNDDELINSPSFTHIPGKIKTFSDEVEQFEVSIEEDSRVIEESREKNWFKKNWKYIIGFLVTIGLMAVLIWQSNPSDFWNCLINANLLLLLGAVGITAVLFILKTIRWQIILGAQETKISFWKTLRLVLIGTFGSAITPAKVGDILRAFPMV